MKKAILGICAVTLALSLAACGGAPASGSAPASQPASAPASQPASEPASQPASEPASEPAEADYAGYVLEFGVPEGLAEVTEPPEGVSALFQAEDGSSLNLVVYENDGSLASDMTQEAIASMVESAFTQQLDTDVALQDVAFETGMLGDVCPYYRLSFTLEVSGVAMMTQTYMGINADRAYTFTYTDMTGGWAEAFEDSIASITPVAQ